MSWEEIRIALSALRILFPMPARVTVETHDTALQIAARHGYGIYDALQLAAALRSSCKVF